MGEPLKTFFSPAFVKRLAFAVAEVHGDFSSRAFMKDATAGLDELELLDRGKHIATALSKHFDETLADRIRQAVGPRPDVTENSRRVARNREAVAGPELFLSGLSWRRQADRLHGEAPISGAH